MLLAGAIGLRMVVSNQDVHDAVLAALSKDGTNSFTVGNLKILAWPRPVAVLEDVAFGDTGPARVMAPTVTATLNVLPLLFGKVEIGDLKLERAQVVLTVTDGMAVSAGRDDDTPDIRLVDGRVSIVGPHGPIEQLDEVTADVVQDSSTLKLSGTFRLRGEAVEAVLSLGDTVALARGARAPLRLRLTTAAAELAFNGHALAGRNLQLDGALAVDGTSLRNALTWYDFEPAVRGGLGRFSLAGHVTVSGGQFALRRASLELDGNRAEGGLTVRVENGRPTVQGTLAAPVLNLDPYVVQLPVLQAGRWASERFDISALTALDADLRLSAGSIAIGSVTFGRTAGAVVVRGGRLSLTLGEAEAFAGVLRGTLALTQAADGAELRVDAVAHDVDLDRFGQDVFGTRRFEGRGVMVMGLEGHGASAAAVARSLTGEVKVNATAGALTGVNVEQILRRIEKRPLVGTGDLRGGRTAFDRLAVQLQVIDGRATCEDVVMEGPLVRISVVGAASIGERMLDLKGVAALVKTTGNGFELPFVIRGPWDSPSVVPDAESLIRRSGAAAPLLERAVQQVEPVAAPTATAATAAGAAGAAAGTPAGTDTP
ncbi:putative assembly protein [Blastochloris viridis]|uniref:Putative assembly protein n=1 Tax=Blastochloris viridis TaxID=1079 RepID=A0A0S4Q5G9_BLAVI|nr:putative assembly protein [Blastochloris viridis]